MRPPFGTIAMELKVERDAGPLGRSIGGSDVVHLIDARGVFTNTSAAALLRGLADELDPPPAVRVAP